MAFESLSDRLSDIFQNLSGKGKLSEEDVNLALRNPPSEKRYFPL